MAQKHKVFVSFYHQDQKHKEKFVSLMKNHMIDKSIDTGDIDDSNIKVDTIRSKIRDEYIRDATVTVVLIGKDTWRRKHVDWEIASSIRDTKHNSRTGLLGILLPTYPSGKCNPCTIPPRLYNNIECGFADIYSWSNYSNTIQGWVHKAFKKRKTEIPNNSYPHFANNRSTKSSGWC